MKKNLINTFAFLCLFFLHQSRILAQSTNKLESTGNAGVGTTSPGTKFHVLGYEGANWLTTFDNNGTSGHKAYFGYNDGSSTTHGLYIAGGRGLSTQIDLGVDGKFYVMGNGYVGIGTSSPVNPMVISNGGAAGFEFTPSTGSLFTYNRSGSAYTPFMINGSKVSLGIAGSPKLFVDSSGNVGVGTTSPSEKLSVSGNIKANGNIIVRKVIVTQSGWPDYVFTKDYKLRSLNSLESYIIQNKHLPGIPSTKEVEEKGISVGDNQALLLKKVEELTLYIIAQQKQIDELRKQINKK